MFNIENLTVRVQEKNLVHNISFAVPKGQITAVIGESGSGKSTTVSAVLGIIPPQANTTGAVLWEGSNMLEMANEEKARLRAKHFFTIFQDASNSFSPSQKMKHQLFALTALRLGHKKALFLATMTSILKDLNLPESVLNCYPFELSGGMLQRCMLACALYIQPDVLIADEPTSALDMLHQQDFMKLLKNYHTQLGTTILLITHDLGVAASIADTIVVMKNGEVVEKGPVANIFQQPKHPYTKRLVANHF